MLTTLLFVLELKSSSFILLQFKYKILYFQKRNHAQEWHFNGANNGRSREKKKFLAKRFAHAISVHHRDFEHTYVYWIWLRGSASYVII